MGLLQKLKSALGLDASSSPATSASTPQSGDVTVEREPSTESEDAVKGTDTDTPDGQHDETASTGDVGTDTAASETEAETETDESTSSVSDDEPVVENDAPVTEIKGVGPAYAERLENAGVSTVSDLAVADTDELAEATDLSTNRIAGWIEQAGTY